MGDIYTHNNSNNNSKAVKPRPITARAKAFFGSWSSEVASARVLYVPAEDRIVFVAGNNAQKNGGEWVMPYFPPKSYERLLAYARRMYEEGYPRHRARTGDAAPARLKGHRPDLCKRCIELGRPCIRR